MNTDVLPAPPAPRPNLLRRALRKINVVFWVTVAMPTALSALYFGLMASDTYISESRFVVRSPQRAAPAAGISALLASTGIAHAHDDTYTVMSYVMSRDALAELQRTLDLRRIYSGHELDIFDRFPGLKGDKSIEALYDYYGNHILIDYDSTASIATLQVRTHDAKASRDINEQLLQLSERLVNNLNERSRRDLIEVAERQVKEYEERAHRANAALSAFRSKDTVYDPDRESAAGIDTLTRLREELRVTEVQINRLKSLAPSNPQLPSLEQAARGLRANIDAEQSKVVGAKSSLASKSSQFDRLVLEKQLAEKELAGAVESLASARDDADRKQLYLERLVQPNLPDYPLEPMRIKGVFTTFLLGLVAWGVATMLVNGVKEHMD